jgi:hypothetical protein
MLPFLRPARQRRTAGTTAPTPRLETFMADDAKQAAERALDDPSYAQELLSSDEYPEVKQAIVDALTTAAAADAAVFQAFVDSDASSGDGLRAIAGIDEDELAHAGATMKPW